MAGANETLDLELNLDADWSLGEKTFREIVSFLKDFNSKRILEFGSGASSVRFALNLPECDIISVEHDQLYADKTKVLKNRHQISNLSLVYAPLKHRWFGLSRYLTYAFNASITKFDSIIIDGPPSAVRGGREACLFLVYDNLKTGGYIFLDDYHRAAEQRAVQNWLETYPGSFEWFVIESGHRVAVLRKIKHVKPRLFTSGRMGRNLKSYARDLMSDLKGLLKR